MNEIKMIPIDQLWHHPDNPRLDIGDIDELTNSIKANGILQNLTVVFEPEHKMTPHEWEYYSAYSLTEDGEVFKSMMKTKTVPDRYLVVIGNRRLEASKAAGLTELPCSIREMDHQEQIATMLQENMQRTDLTIYEQAKGIQMMMNLGFTKEQVSERTGFSKSTIERRLAVASLPEEETRDAVDCGWDLTDLVEISKIEDRKTQARLLTGTSKENLRQQIESAKRDQERKKERTRLLPDVKAFATEMTEAQASQRYGSSWEHLNKYDVHLEPEAKVNVPKEEGKYYYYEAWGTIEIWQKAKREKRVKSDAEIALEKKQHEAKELNARMKENRIAFCASWKPTRTQETALKAKLWQYVFDNVSSYDNGGFQITYHNWDSSRFRQLCGMPKEEGRDKNETIYAELARRGIPMGRAILAWILCGGVRSDERTGYASEYNGNYSKDEDMDRIYDILTDNGYQLTEEEQQWKDGTHSIYPKKEAPAEEPDEEPDAEDPEEDPEEEE
jgi:ParB family chromosome partitioning protein